MIKNESGGMTMFQKLEVIGNLGRDPNTRQTSTGQTVTNFSVATNRRWTANNGQPGEEVIWVRVDVFGKLAEVCQQYLYKGRLVRCEGRLVADPETGGPRVWQDNEGNYRASFEMIAQEVTFLGGVSNADSRGNEEDGESGLTEENKEAETQTGNDQSTTKSTSINSQDEIPF
ncbi:MAG: single-stranded DNA-binding protein [Anaerolineae bacterium]|nr:single-stranded DNA-binding protein [Anaerolineae bacterium]